jgi:hypothetical protein
MLTVDGDEEEATDIRDGRASPRRCAPFIKDAARGNCSAWSWIVQMGQLDFPFPLEERGPSWLVAFQFASVLSRLR